MSIAEEVQQLVNTSPKLRFSDAQLLLLDTYEVGFGIYNHNRHIVDNSRPLSLVAMHWEEDNTYQSLMHERIDQFRERQIHQHFGLSLSEFLEYPRDVCLKILDSCVKGQKKEDDLAAQLQNQLLQAGKTK